MARLSKKEKLTGYNMGMLERKNEKKEAEYFDFRTKKARSKSAMIRKWKTELERQKSFNTEKQQNKRKCFYELDDICKQTRW